MAAVALWIVWVAPYILRNGRQRLQAAGETTGHAADFETQEPQAGPALMLAVQQEKPMDNLQGTPPGQHTPTAPGRRRDSSTSQGPLRIKYGRCTIALVGLVTLFAVPVTGILCLAGIASIWFPVLALVSTAFSVLILRRLAVRDRRRRLRAALRAAMSTPSVEAAAGDLTPPGQAAGNHSFSTPKQANRPRRHCRLSSCDRRHWPWRRKRGTRPRLRAILSKLARTSPGSLWSFPSRPTLRPPRRNGRHRNHWTSRRPQSRWAGPR